MSKDKELAALRAFVEKTAEFLRLTETQAHWEIIDQHRQRLYAAITRLREKK